MIEKIVIQETDQDVLDILTDALRIEGFEIFALMECDDRLLDMIEQNKPHVVVLNYKISGEACVLALRRIRERYPHLPVITLSCNSNIHEEHAQHGFDD